jgi:hypothetical protein
LYVDVTRLPRREELFSTTTGYTNAPSPATGGSAGVATAMMASPRPAADLKSVHYYVRPGATVEPGSAAVTSLSPEAQARLGGLVRQEVPRQMRVMAEQTGNSALLDAGASLVAPEVVAIQFRYYNGSEISEDWDMTETKSLPIAVEVTVWLAASSDGEIAPTMYDSTTLANNARAYRQTVYLPMSELAESGEESELEIDTSEIMETGEAQSPASGGTGFGETP